MDGGAGLRGTRLAALRAAGRARGAAVRSARPERSPASRSCSPMSRPASSMPSTRLPRAIIASVSKTGALAYFSAASENTVAVMVRGRRHARRHAQPAARPLRNRDHLTGRHAGDGRQIACPRPSRASGSWTWPAAAPSPLSSGPRPQRRAGLVTRRQPRGIRGRSRRSRRICIVKKVGSAEAGTAAAIDPTCCSRRPRAGRPTVNGSSSASSIETPRKTSG